ncbi:MAG: glycosyltransferase family 2 protein [Bacteroidales bacterium]|jgi:GT2 family glycosyltransferase|nr:glycosyltransferase family 2 protein [Bacteroidales bacterium]
MKIAVVILNWNGKNFLEKFLPNVIEHSADKAEVIVADNASTDNSVEFLKQNFPNIRLIQNAENGGFSKGYNDALKHVEADYLVLLNSDIEVAPNWIQPVIDLMESDKNIAVCQPKIRSYCEREKFEYAGAAGGFIDRFGYPFCRGRIFDTLETDNGQYDDVCEIFWATGAAMFVKASIYREFGGLDEDFFAHMEEIDFCWRVKNAGYKVMYCPNSVVYHIGGGTLPKHSPRKTYLNFRNNLSLLYKNLYSSERFFVFLMRMTLDELAAAKFLFGGSFGDFCAVYKAYFHFIKTFPKIRKKRKQQITICKHHSGKFDFSIVWKYYIAKQKIFWQATKNGK